VRAGVFGLGLARALGGVMATPLVSAHLGMGVNVVVDAFVIVIIGGMGSSAARSWAASLSGSCRRLATSIS
jgi:branched-subunit amino acid ABC-type transport system permease component